MDRLEKIPRKTNEISRMHDGNQKHLLIYLPFFYLNSFLGVKLPHSKLHRFRVNNLINFDKRTHCKAIKIVNISTALPPKFPLALP